MDRSTLYWPATPPWAFLASQYTRLPSVSGLPTTLAMPLCGVMTPSLMVEPLKPGTFGGVFCEWAPPAKAAGLVAPAARAAAATTPKSRPSFFPLMVVPPLWPSVGERPGPEVCLNPPPDPGQASRLEDQKDDDQQRVDDGAERPLAEAGRRRVAGDDGPAQDGQVPIVRHELLDDRREGPDDDGTQDRSVDRADAAYHDDGKELDREHQPERGFIGRQIPDVEAVQNAGQGRDRGGDRERADLVTEQAHADDLGGDVAVPDGLQRPARAGADDVLHQQRGHEDEAPCEVHEPLLGSQLLAEHRRFHEVDRPEPEVEIRLRRHGAALVAARERRPLLPDIQRDEHQPEGDDHEIVPGQAKGGQADEYADGCAGDHGDEHVHEQVEVVADAVGEPPAAVVPGHERAQADEGRVPERRLTRVPGQKVEPDGADRDDTRQGQDAGPRIVDHVGQDQIERDERHDADTFGGGWKQPQVVGVVADHGARGSRHQTLRTSGVPNKPNGRMSRMSSMMRYGTM